MNISFPMNISFSTKPRMLRRVAVLFLGVITMGLCVAVFDQLGFGADPCSAMNLAVSRLIGWGFGTYQLLFNIALLAVVILLGGARRIGLGTLANMVLVGYAADAGEWILNHTHPLTGEALGVKLMVFVPAIALFVVSLAFYMVVDLGAAPYDAAPQLIAARQNRFSPAIVRVAWDVAAILICLLAGGTVGPVTIAIGFLLGPVISAIARRFRQYF